MLEVPPIIFINCIGSSVYSIVEDRCRHQTPNPVLYYLSTGIPTYKPFSVNRLPQTAWGYQPIFIHDSQGRQLNIDGDFYMFLTEKLNIAVDVCKIDSQTNVIDILYNNFKKGINSICAVDEYYVPGCEYFKERHNKHFLLISQIWLQEEKLEIIDSEAAKPFIISFQDMEQAVGDNEIRKKEILSINSSNFECKVDIELLQNQFLHLDHNSEYIVNFQTEVKHNLQLANPEYYYRGLYYNILSRLLPYAEMCFNITKGIDPLGIVSQELLTSWKELKNYMLFKHYKHDYQYLPIFNKLEQILALYEKWNALRLHIIGEF